GMSMDLVAEILSKATVSPQLPDFAREFYAPLCLDAMQRDLPTGKLPSLSIGPVLSGALVSTEVLMILLKGKLAGVREPICLPRVLMMDAFTAKYQVASLPDMLACQAKSDGNGRIHAPTAAALFPPDRAPARERFERLQAAHFNTHLLSANDIKLDL